jgi:hypothetical protein
MDSSGHEHRLANGELHAAIAQGGEEQQQQQQQQHHVNSADAVPSDVAELLVVRHGETTWNAAARLQGHAESDLNDVGKQQALAVKCCSIHFLLAFELLQYCKAHLGFPDGDEQSCIVGFCSVQCCLHSSSIMSFFFFSGF